MRGRVRRVAVLVAVLAVWFAIFEAGLRQWGSSEAAPAFQGLFTGDPVVGYRLQPGARTTFSTSEFTTRIDINQAGVRDDDEIGPKGPGEYRVLVLGDSLVLSVQVPFEQTFTERLEQQLNAGQKGETEYRVINAGVQGYGPVEALLLFRQHLRRLEPDLVLISIFVGNDAEEAMASRTKLQARRPVSELLTESLMTRLQRAVRRSMVLQVLRLRVVTATGRFRSTSGPPEPPLQSYARHPSPRIVEGISLTTEIVKQLADEGEALGARTGILLMPARLQLDDGDYGRLRDIVQAAGGELVRDSASVRFGEALSSLGLPMLDLLGPLRAAGPGPDLFFQENVHLTDRGHAVVAAGVERFLNDAGLLPR